MAQYIFFPVSISESWFLPYKFLRSEPAFLRPYTLPTTPCNIKYTSTLPTQTFDTDKTNCILRLQQYTLQCSNVPDANRTLYRVPVSETQVTGKEGAWKTDRSVISSSSSSSSSSTLPLNSAPPPLCSCSWKSSSSLFSSEAALDSESWGIKHTAALRQRAESVCGWAWMIGAHLCWSSRTRWQETALSCSAGRDIVNLMNFKGKIGKTKPDVRIDKVLLGHIFSFSSPSVEAEDASPERMRREVMSDLLYFI